MVRCINLDKYIIKKREDEYRNIRKNVFLNMSSKHCSNECLCLEKNKTCNLSGIVDLDKFNDKEYLSELYDNGILDSLYNIFQSITQSLRSSTGKTFENIIEKTFSMVKLVDYKSQVELSFNNESRKHVVDFMIPSPISIPVNLEEYNGIIISCKTTLRERYLQDKFLNNDKIKIITITMDESTKSNDIITIDKDKKTYTKWLNKVLSTNKMKVLDLFCGAGGFSKGFSDAGFEVIAGIDIWDKAIETYKQNNNHLALCRDLTEYGPEQLKEEYGIENIDILIGGPSCQGFSNAGKRDVNDPRNSLFLEYVKYLDYYKPKMFIMENVIGILSHKNSNNEKCIDIISRILEINYNIRICKLMASDFEVPQNRRRVLIFGIRKDLDILPTEPIPILKKENRIPVSTILLNREDVDKSCYLSERALIGIQNKKQRMIAEGKGFGAQILKMDKPSYTIPARYWKDGYDALVEYSETEIRRLTITELARIQSFPDTYKFFGSKKDIIMQIGNAVACRFAYHVAKHCKSLLTKKVDEVTKLNVTELRKLCKERNLKNTSRLKKQELIDLLK